MPTCTLFAQTNFALIYALLTTLPDTNYLWLPGPVFNDLAANSSAPSIAGTAPNGLVVFLRLFTRRHTACALSLLLYGAHSRSTRRLLYIRYVACPRSARGVATLTGTC